MNIFLPLPVLLVDVGVVAFSVVVLLWWRSRHKRSFATMFLWGGLLAIATWALGLALVLLQGWLIMTYPTDSPLAVHLLILALTLLNTSAVYLIILGGALFTPLRKASWEQTVAVGLSYGSVTNVILVSHYLLVQSGILTFPSRVALAYSKRILISAITLRLSLIPTIAFGAFACMLIIHAVQTKSWKWFALGFVWLLARPGGDRLLATLPTPVRYSEVSILISRIIGSLIFGIIGLWGLSAMRRHWQVPPSDEEAA